ncbi:cation/H(+) antiporter 15-like [Musa acuminata AAA Group]|uniref:cation/H(+) antiporter 15-like n=1 Tax=Musa acuminata AAA Group TaxID=214697 RepID=UPI0031DB9A6C
MALPNDEQLFLGGTNSGTRQILCYRAVMTTSTGFWVDDNPFNFSLPTLIYQITVIFVLFRLTHVVLRRLSQPVVISQIVAGIILSGDVLGRNQRFAYLIFPPYGFEQINVAAILASMLFFFVVGVKADLGLMLKAGKKAAAIALLGTLLPAVSVYLTAKALRHKIPHHFMETQVLLAVSDKWSITSFAVLSCLLSELNLLSSKLGRLALSATLISDFVHLFLAAFVKTYSLSVKLHSAWKGLSALLCFFCVVALILFVLRPIVLWLIRRTPEGALLDEASFVAVLTMALACGVLTAVTGFDVSTGPFFFGLVLPGGAPLGATMVQRMDGLVMGILLPTNIVMAGMATRISVLAGARHWGLFEMFLLICVVTKFVGVTLPCFYSRMAHRDTVSLGLMMITKGIFEVCAAIRWHEDKVVDNTDYTMVIITILVFGGGTAPLIKYLYHPEDRFVAYKRRTVQHVRPGDELRLLACVHEQDNVNPVLALLEATGPSPDSPICTYLLHLVQLVGRADAVFHLHRRHRKPYSSVATLSESDHIVNAFQLFERQHPDGFSVLPYVCISPYNTMHNDICSLALDKKAALVILPFHKKVNADGSINSASTGIHAVNVNVLQHAPCSVGILVDNGLSSGGQLLERVAIYFLGGADDREALAYGVRMADHAAIGLTVIRLLPLEEGQEEGREERMDDRMLKQFQHKKVDGNRVVYREEVVKDGEGTVDVIHETSPEFSLLIVGRRAGKESPLTVGMSMWSEYPELGVIGDLLASTDCGSRASTLVVQQQVWVVGEAALAAESRKSAATGSQVVPEAAVYTQSDGK